jgi:ERCC4-related helicase
MSTPFHAKYFAHQLSIHHKAGFQHNINSSLFDANVDLNPHQIDAALFALRSPLSKGVILADEVGLGKTIEAGLVACQYWAERKRRILIICPASLRKQWSSELVEKFHLPNTVLETRLFNKIFKKESNPFQSNSIVICSIHFAARHSAKLRTIPWDLVIIDEAHKLRNVYKPNNKMGQQIKWALEDKKKILLTATPLQNSLIELYGLSSLIDEQYFGDINVFREKYARNENSDHLRDRLIPIVKRTLRSQVVEYIQYTQRQSLTLFYEPPSNEQHLYERISEFILAKDSLSIPPGQRHLLALILRKLLASSTAAITFTLKVMKDRLELLRSETKSTQSFVEQLVYEEELEEELVEEFVSDEMNENDDGIDPQKLNEEIATISSLITQALKIKIDAKSVTLLEAIKVGFEKLAKMEANQKVVIFTESRRTQDYLFNFLSENGHRNDIVLFNGSNTDALSGNIYQQWIEANKKSERISGSKNIDIRTALIEHFRNSAKILIATEAAAEGINLQFCSMVINYDLPWNPQRIEQRIGRCHRYGQKFDVVVINFINKLNETDQRVFELLNEKFNLFSGVFGASDDVLGNIESGVDFERRIMQIYEDCRSTEEIDGAFKTLTQEMETSIQDRLKNTRRILLEHFDQDVHDKLVMTLDNAREQLDRTTFYFWELSKIVLADTSEFDDLAFNLYKSPLVEVPPGKYYLKTQKDQDVSNEYLYRLTHPLGEYVLSKGRALPNLQAHIYFDLTNHTHNISMLNKFKRQSGWILLKHLQINSFEKEDYLVFSGITDGGRELDQELCEKFFLLRGATSPIKQIDDKKCEKISSQIDKRIDAIEGLSQQINHKYFIEECDKLDQWADDIVFAAESELISIKRDIKELNRFSRSTENVVEQHRHQVKLGELETKKRKTREKIYNLEDDMIEKRERFIKQLVEQKQQEKSVTTLFTIRWTII